MKTSCPTCGQAFELAGQHVGRKARCHKCNTLFRIAPGKSLPLTADQPSEVPPKKLEQPASPPAETRACPPPANLPSIWDVGNDVASLKAILQANPDLAFSKDNEGCTALHRAAEHGHKNVAELLLANKAEVDAKDNFGVTALSLAAMNGHKDVAEMLLAHGAQVHFKSTDGATALHMAAAWGQKATVELLLANKAEVNAKDNRGLTPLHWAVAKGHPHVVEWLLANGADANAKDQDGETALDLAVSMGRKDLTELLRQRGGCADEKAVINTRKLDESALVDENGKLIGLWFKSREQATNTDLLAGILVLHKMKGRTIEPSDFKACREGLCKVVASDGGYSVLFPSAKS